MTEPTLEVPGVGPEPIPEDNDAPVLPEDGEQDVDQTAGYEEAESDSDQEDDPEVHEVA